MLIRDDLPELEVEKTVLIIDTCHTRRTSVTDLCTLAVCITPWGRYLFVCLFFTLAPIWLPH
jgi:hypothetical protein